MLSLSGCVLADQLTLPPVIDNSSYPDTAPPPVPANNAAGNPAALYELVQRVDKLQAEVQQLTGKVEEQGNLINELKKQQTSAYSDLDERIQRLEKGGTATTAPATETAPPTTVEVEPATPATETPPNTPADVRNIAVIPAPPQETQAAPAATTKPEVQATGDEKKTYQQAYEALRNGKTDDSIQLFQTYLSQYPNGGYADLANYWLGEAYRVKPNANAARQSFNTVLQQYPNSTKIADTLLKLGYIEADEKQNDKAREYLNRVVNEFPNTPAARSAAKKLTQLK
ncbi:Cell division coordinator CpoB [uncultured bacterium]|nr:Cell division coordinator CpoB [uncultured bacterium]